MDPKIWGEVYSLYPRSPIFYRLSRGSSLMPKMHEDAPEVFIILLDTVIEGANMLLIEKADHLFLERAAALAGNDFDQFDLPVDGFLNDAIQFNLDLVALIVNVVQIKFELGHVLFLMRDGLFAICALS